MSGPASTEGHGEGIPIFRLVIHKISGTLYIFYSSSPSALFLYVSSFLGSQLLLRMISRHRSFHEYTSAVMKMEEKVANLRAQSRA